MTRFLVFQLFGPLAAWGEVAVGEARAASRIPSRSGVLGLLGAALGLRRDDPRLAALNAGFGVATRTDGQGALVVDYHTTQTAGVASVRKKSIRTRREELAAAGRDAHTITSRREYWSDLLHVVAVWARPSAPYALEQLRDALEAPHYPLYLGRRNCPPALPLAPRLVNGPDPVTVLRGAHPNAATMALLGPLSRAASFEVAGEDFPVAAPHQVHTRRDEPGSRSAWQFSTRPERRAHFERDDDVPH